jgi:uncharacterized membrane protein
MHGLARAPDASAQAMAASRSKHNAYMSVPVVFAMVSNMYDRDDGWAMMTALVLVGFALRGRSTRSRPVGGLPPRHAE